MAFTKTEITSSTLLGQWPGIINSIADGVIDNANNIVNSIGSVYSFNQYITESFDDALSRYQEAHPEVVFKKNDVVVVTLIDVNNVVYEQAAYTHDGNAFVACTGAVDADKVIMREDITLAGNYTSVGNISKGTATAKGLFESKGMSVADILTEILSKRLQPASDKTVAPSVSSFGLKSGTATSVEAGSVISKVEYTSGTFKDGSYEYDTTAGVTVTGWRVERVVRVAGATSDSAGVEIYSGETLPAGTDTNNSMGFQIGDKAGYYGEGTDNPVLSSLKYVAYADHTAGNLASDNLGDPCTNNEQIGIGSKSKTSGTISCYRNYFYGSLTTDSASAPIDGALIRSLTPSGKVYGKNNTFEIKAGVDGVKRMIIACVSTAVGPVSAKDTHGIGDECIGSFVPMTTTVNVAGANGYEPIAYKVWVYEPAVPMTSNVGYNIKLG